MKKYFFVIILLLNFSACNSPQKTDRQAKENDVLEGAFWRHQALQNIMPYWLRYSIDEKNGAFYTNLNRDWQIVGNTDKYPGMISRHIFSNSAAYLLSGDEKYLKVARKAVDYLIKHGWDSEYGGWYDALSENGKPSRVTKNMFNTIYANSGLALYYFVTHDLNVLHYIEESNKIIESRVWDKKSGGYFATLNRDLSIRNSEKNFTTQFASISGYLLYLYLATSDKAYLEQMKRIVNVVLPYMTDEKSGFVLEKFDSKWQYIGKPAKDGTEVNVGHNVEAAWVLFRLYGLTGDSKYLQEGKRLGDLITRWGYDSEQGVWFDDIGRQDPSLHSQSANWWAQACGNMLQLFLYNLYRTDKYLYSFSKGAKFWNNYFLDKEKGGAFTSVYLDGTMKDGTKATGAKTSYHSMEQCFLNFLYLNLWVEKKPVQLHFAIQPQKSQFKHNVIIVEDKNIEIKKVIVNGKDWTNFDAKRGYLNLPGGEAFRIKVTLGK